MAKARIDLSQVFEVGMLKLEVGSEESFPPQNKDFANSSFSSGRDSAAPRKWMLVLRAALFMPLLGPLPVYFDTEGEETARRH